MSKVNLGRTNIEVDKNGFGALPIQRIDKEETKKILLKAFDNGITYFDTARVYSDSEEKIGYSLSKVRNKIFIATKTMSLNVDGFWKDLNESLTKLKTDYIDIYQFHNPPFMPEKDGEDGLYNAMLKAKKQGKIRFIGITNHRLKVAEETLNSNLYDTLQFPFSYLADKKDIAIAEKAKEKNIGFIAMKGMSGGLISNSKAAYAFMNQYDNVLPIWGIQKESELDEFLSYSSNVPEFTQEIRNFIENDRKQLNGDFCRGCGYCLPCPANIDIPLSARISLLLRRAPIESNTTKEAREKMKRIENCINCNHCINNCPYGLNTPKLLKENYEDYKNFIKNLN